MGAEAHPPVAVGACGAFPSLEAQGSLERRPQGLRTLFRNPAWVPFSDMEIHLESLVTLDVPLLRNPGDRPHTLSLSLSRLYIHISLVTVAM